MKFLGQMRKRHDELLKGAVSEGHKSMSIEMDLFADHRSHSQNHHRKPGKKGKLPKGAKKRSERTAV